MNVCRNDTMLPTSVRQMASTFRRELGDPCVGCLKSPIISIRMQRSNLFRTCFAPLVWPSGVPRLALLCLVVVVVLSLNENHSSSTWRTFLYRNLFSDNGSFLSAKLAALSWMNHQCPESTKLWDIPSAWQARSREKGYSQGSWATFVEGSCNSSWL